MPGISTFSFDRIEIKCGQREKVSTMRRNLRENIFETFRNETEHGMLRRFFVYRLLRGLPVQQLIKD